MCYALVGENISMIVILQFWAGSAKLYISGNHVIRLESPEDINGVNDQKQLESAAEIIRRRKKECTL